MKLLTEDYFRKGENVSKETSKRVASKAAGLRKRMKKVQSQALKAVGLIEKGTGLMYTAVQSLAVLTTDVTSVAMSDLAQREKSPRRNRRKR